MLGHNTIETWQMMQKKWLEELLPACALRSHCFR